MKNYEFLLSPEKLANLTGGVDFVTPLTKYNGPVKATKICFFVVAPFSICLNAFVFASCLYITLSKNKNLVGFQFRPAFVFIAFNALLDLFGIAVDGIIVTELINPSIANADPLPDEDELLWRCRLEKAFITFVVFSSLFCVILLTLDRFLFIVWPLRYPHIMTTHRAVIATLTAVIISASLCAVYSVATRLMWDKVCAATHTIPFGLMIVWTVLFFSSWLAMHFMYGFVGLIALKHKRRDAANKPASTVNIPIVTLTSTDHNLTGNVENEDIPAESEDENSAKDKKLSIFSQISKNVSETSNQIGKVIRTIRYILVLLVIYSLVELPSIAVGIEDLVTHSEVAVSSKCINNNGEEQPRENSSVSLPDDGLTAVSLLSCLEKFIEEGDKHSICKFQTTAADLPWCEMVSQTSHSLELIRIFTLSTFAWTLNALLDPIIYAFWYPVFRNNLKTLKDGLLRRNKPD